MNRYDRYYAYAGFALGLHVADLAMRGALVFRGEEILKQLNAISGGDGAPSPSALSLIQLFPRSDDNRRFVDRIHPVLVSAAEAMIESRNERGGEAGFAIEP
jgi:hypothetical protein